MKIDRTLIVLTSVFFVIRPLMRTITLKIWIVPMSALDARIAYLETQTHKNWIASSLTESVSIEQPEKEIRRIFYAQGW